MWNGSITVYLPPGLTMPQNPAKSKKKKKLEVREKDLLGYLSSAAIATLDGWMLQL